MHNITALGTYNLDGYDIWLLIKISMMKINGVFTSGTTLLRSIWIIYKSIPGKFAMFFLNLLWRGRWYYKMNDSRCVYIMYINPQLLACRRCGSVGYKYPPDSESWFSKFSHKPTPTPTPGGKHITSTIGSNSAPQQWKQSSSIYYHRLSLIIVFSILPK